jgi:hypothetical protein
MYIIYSFIRMYIKFYIDLYHGVTQKTLGTMRGWKNMGKMLRYISAGLMSPIVKKR